MTTPGERAPAKTSRGDIEDALETRVARRSIGEVVGDHIRRLVFDGALREGDRVPQREIAAAFGVSSIPVREALVALQREGVISLEPNRGAFVNRLDGEVAREQFYVFGRVYGLATRRVAERADDATLDELTRAAAAVEAATDPETLLQTSVRFEWIILNAGGSKRLHALFLPVSRIVPGNFFEEIPGSAEATRRGVATMTAALRARDAAGAERACWDLIDAIGELVAARLDERAEG